MGSNDTCNFTNLALGLGLFHGNPDQKIKEKSNNLVLKFDHIFPSLSLGSFDPTASSEDHDHDHDHDHHEGKASGSISLDSSYSNNSSMVIKKEENFEVEKGVVISTRSMMSDEDEEASPRKKLRLTKQQSAILEDSFKQHSTLNPAEKQALAKQLNLRARQVEVWFQNRRARTKLKQTEFDCELLRKCCEALTHENHRLHRELQELRALKLPTLLMQVPPSATALTVCPSCERTNTGDSGGDGPLGAGLAARPKARSSTTC